MVSPTSLIQDRLRRVLEMNAPRRTLRANGMQTTSCLHRSFITCRSPCTRCKLFLYRQFSFKDSVRRRTSQHIFKNYRDAFS
jgi:hypothetical protein